MTETDKKLALASTYDSMVTPPTIDVDIHGEPQQGETKVEVLRPTQLAGLQVQSVVDTPLNFNFLVYGESGVGKTVLCGSACVVPELSPVLLLDIEGGTLSLRRRYPEVETVRIRNWSQVVKVYEALKSGATDHRTVIIDSLTEAQKLGMSTIMRAAVEKDSDRDPDLPGIGEFGKNTNQMRAMVRAFRDLPMNVMFTALVDTDKDKRGNILTRPSLTPKLSREVAGFLDVVLYMYLKEVDGEQHRLLLTRKTEEVIAKDRTDNLPKVIDTPDAKQLYTMMFAG